jgi:hypothetical protein
MMAVSAGYSPDRASIERFTFFTDITTLTLDCNSAAECCRICGFFPAFLSSLFLTAFFLPSLSANFDADTAP